MASGGGGVKTLQKIVAPPPLTVIKIVKYCGVREGGHWRGGAGAPKSYKINSVSHLCHYDSKVFWNRGGGALGGAKILVKYCGQKYNAYKQYHCILPVTN